MSSYTILITKRFEKDLEICKKRELKLSLLYTVIEQLKLNGTLPKQYRAHKLSGNYANYWECHIKGDWLLIWEQNDDELIDINLNRNTFRFILKDYVLDTFSDIRQNRDFHYRGRICDAAPDTAGSGR